MRSISRFAQSFIVDIDGDFVEERIDARAQFGHRMHCRRKIFLGDGRACLPLCDIDCLGQRLLFGELVFLRIGRTGVRLFIFFLFDANDVGRALVTGEQILAVIAFQELPKRLDASDDQN